MTWRRCWCDSADEVKVKLLYVAFWCFEARCWVSHTIHVWYIYLHVTCSIKVNQMYVNVSYMDGMGIVEFAHCFCYFGEAPHPGGDKETKRGESKLKKWGQEAGRGRHGGRNVVETNRGHCIGSKIRNLVSRWLTYEYLACFWRPVAESRK